MKHAFVILEHSGHGAAHYDLMLEQDGAALATWQLEEWHGLANEGADSGASSSGPARIGGSRVPSGEIASGPVPGRRLPDHRRDYLAYEGPVRGGRGQVRRVEAGTYELLRADEGLWEVRFNGARLRGRYELRRVGPMGDAWELRRLSDPAARSP